LAVLITALHLPLPGQSQVLERMLMPGPLVQGHAEFEKDCGLCHSNFSSEKQTALCLDCHEDIAKDLDSKTGFHGRNTSVQDRQCADCHTEHEGRDGIISPVTNSSFRHDSTNFPLEGAHLTTACDECHVAGKPRRDAEETCVACHREQDAHDGRLGEDCAQCHSPQSWRDSLFNHAEKTDFPLEGGHAMVTCVGCHGAANHEDASPECVSCHLRDDVHAGVNGRECQQCHKPEEWKNVTFDHATDGKWALLGKHMEVACNLCHTMSLTEPKLETTCVSCHRSDDAHQGKNGEACEDCHNNDSWTENDFDHAEDTDFPLRGTHEKLQCVACHRGSMDEELPVACVSCHKNADIHQESLGDRCESCHSDLGWLVELRFDHDLTTFPLVGSHAVAPCETCHFDKRYHDTGSGCIDCHAKDDDHQGSLGEQCASCHNPNGWAFWTFDHDTQTEFLLQGAHKELACNSCHAPGGPAAEDMARICQVCHRKDDVHRGRFGKNCGQCHTNDSFSEVRRLQ
jgi:hypothetical protein